VKSKRTEPITAYYELELTALATRGIRPEKDENDRWMLPSHACVRTWVPLPAYAWLLTESRRLGVSFTDHCSSALEKVYHRDNQDPDYVREDDEEETGKATMTQLEMQIVLEQVKNAEVVDGARKEAANGRAVINDGASRVNVSLDLLSIVVRMLGAWDTTDDE